MPILRERRLLLPPRSLPSRRNLWKPVGGDPTVRTMLTAGYFPGAILNASFGRIGRLWHPIVQSCKACLNILVSSHTSS
ncbi:hypothetical protein NA56DRAFT_652208 [Hyaloscypha hepaticicola]|uniref:Uncharacterized protein n=1 Tax=Hyaloscypha hepaticicola TaxID=2082293 RepID=A0A2J6PFM9_9HELO|nr:hypothetical protein NA56DRAFT_652208 [Hyaloscypha hepaticicola]